LRAAVIWALAAMFGLHLIFDAAPSLLWALKIGGAGYLAVDGLAPVARCRHPLRRRRQPPRAALAPCRLPAGPMDQPVEPQGRCDVSSIFLGTPGGHALWVLACLLVVILTAETAWNSLVARIFSLDRTRAAYISLKTVIDRSFGAALALLGVKIVAT
jgi:threonine/homoserine/homoserine lactone efflux protein